MTDAEYKKYLSEKTFAELFDIYENFNKSQNPSRHALIAAHIEKKRQSDADGFAKYLEQKKYETIAPRIGAAIIDTVLIWLMTKLGTYVLENLEISLESFIYLAPIINHMFWLGVILIPMVLRSQTIGMRFAQVKLFDISGEPATYRQRLLRECIFVVPPLLFSLLPEFAFQSWTGKFVVFNFGAVVVANPVYAYLNDKHLALNDLVAKTVILRETKLSGGPRKNE